MRICGALLTICLLVLEVPAEAQAPAWHLSATVAESCSCTISCPCNFGGSPNRHPCEGNRMISIDQGRYGDVDLAGVQFLVTFTMSTWSKIYVSDKVTPQQEKAVEALLPLAFAGFHRGMLSFSKVPITMAVSDARVRFSTPESSVDMEVVRGYNGQAIKVLNLPGAALQDYTQFKSVLHQHTSASHSWKHSGTNGFVSKMTVASGRAAAAMAQPAASYTTGGEFYLAYRVAFAKATSIDELLPWVAQGRREQISKAPADERKEAFEMIKMFDDRVEVTVIQETPSASGAELQVEGVSAESRAKATGVITLVKEAGGWKIERESWKGGMGQ